MKNEKKNAPKEIVSKIKTAIVYPFSSENNLAFAGGGGCKCHCNCNCQCEKGM